MKQIMMFVYLYMLNVAVCDYELRVRIHSYSNPESKCAECNSSEGSLLIFPTHTCCDNNTNTGVCEGEELCDTYFRYCIGPFGQPCLISDSDVTRFFRRDIDTMDFEGFVFGTPNPLLFSGSVWTAKFFNLRSEDGDRHEGLSYNQAIDLFAVNIDIEGGQRLERQVYHGVFGLADIELSIELVCTDSYNLPDCTACEPESSSLCINRSVSGQQVGTTISLLEATTSTPNTRTGEAPTTVSVNEPPGETTADAVEISSATAIVGGVMGGACFLALFFCNLVLMALLIHVHVKRKKQEDNTPTNALNQPPALQQEVLQTNSNQAYITVKTQVDTGPFEEPVYDHIDTALTTQPSWMDDHHI